MLNINDNIRGHSSQIKKLSLLRQSHEIPQTMLFSGISGIGKKIISNIFLKSLICNTDESSPCNSCRKCMLIDSGTYPDFITISPNEKGKIPIGSEEKKEIGSIRWLIDRLSKKAVTGTYAALIDGIDKASEEAQNALLKTIEEPSENTYIILISSNRSKILRTILSRCIEIKFYPLHESDIKSVIQDKQVSENDTGFIAAISGGSLEIAQLLTNDKIVSEIMALCKDITTFAMGKDLFNNSFKTLKSIVNVDTVLDIIINIYRINLLMIYNTDNSIMDKSNNADSLQNQFFKNIFINESKKISSIIKILLAMKKGQNHNLNIAYALKGMLYQHLNKSINYKYYVKNQSITL